MYEMSVSNNLLEDEIEDYSKNDNFKNFTRQKAQDYINKKLARFLLRAASHLELLNPNISEILWKQ